MQIDKVPYNSINESPILSPVANITALKNINTSSVTQYINGVQIVVISENVIYELNRSSSEAENLPSIVRPNIGVGRWYLIGGGIIEAVNGTTRIGDSVELGGTLIKKTNIDLGENELTLSPQDESSYIKLKPKVASPLPGIEWVSYESGGFTEFSKTDTNLIGLLNDYAGINLEWQFDPSETRVLEVNLSWSNDRTNGLGIAYLLYGNGTDGGAASDVFPVGGISSSGSGTYQITNLLSDGRYRIYLYPPSYSPSLVNITVNSMSFVGGSLEIPGELDLGITNKSIKFADSGMTITSSTGLAYADDYSVSGSTIFGDRWIPDLGWVKTYQMELYSGYAHDYATTLYVDTVNGLDTNDGSYEKPFKTLQNAVDVRLSPLYIGVDVTIKIISMSDHGTINFDGTTLGNNRSTYIESYVSSHSFIVAGINMTPNSITVLNVTNCRNIFLSGCAAYTINYTSTSGTRCWVGVVGGLVTRATVVSAGSPTNDCTLVLMNSAFYANTGFTGTVVVRNGGHLNPQISSCTIGQVTSTLGGLISVESSAWTLTITTVGSPGIYGEIYLLGTLTVSGYINTFSRFSPSSVTRSGSTGTLNLPAADQIRYPDSLRHRFDPGASGIVAKNVEDAIKEVKSGTPAVVTASNGLTKVGNDIQLGNLFTENIRIYHSGSDGKYYQVDVTDPLAGTVVQSIILKLQQDDAKIQHYNILDYTGNPGEYISGRLDFSGGGLYLGKEANFGTAKSIGFFFDDAVLGTILINSSTNAGGLKYENNLRLNWGSINNTNRYIPDVGWVVDYVASGSTSPSYFDEEITALATTSDGDPATLSGITGIPKGKVVLYVNGVRRICGNGVKTKDYYWSTNGGTTALAFNAVVQGAKPYWNGSVTGFQLETTDIITYDYDV